MPVMAPCPLGGAVACWSLWGVAVEQYPVAVGFLHPPFKDSIPTPKDMEKKKGKIKPVMTVEGTVCGGVFVYNSS